MFIQLLIYLIIAVVYNDYRTRLIRNRLSQDDAVKKFVSFACILLILQSGLRNVAVGDDTYAYSLHFETVRHESWHNIFISFKRVYEAGVGKDPGYMIFVKLVSLVVSEYQIYLIVIATLFFISFGRLLRIFCHSIYDVFIGITLYEVLFYGFFSITGIRQTIAISILFFGVSFIINRKLIPFLLTCLLAATIHKSSLIFIPFYFIAHYKKPPKLLGIIIPCLPLIFAVTRPFAQFLTSFSFSESYAVYANSEYETSGAQMFLVYMLAISVMVLVCRKEINSATDKTKLCYNAFSLGVLFTPLIWVDPSLMRVVMYFSVFSTFFLGGLVRTFHKKIGISLGLFSFVMIVIFMMIIIKRGYEYAFFWQYMSLPDHYSI